MGWLLLPVAFILSLVTFFLKDQGKALAIAAPIISIVGTIVGVIAMLLVVSDAFSSAGGGTATVAPSQLDNTDAVDPNTSNEDGQPEEGSRESPYPLGSTISNYDWSVTVNAFTANATEQVLAASPYSDEPPEGQTYALVNVTITGSSQSTV